MTRSRKPSWVTLGVLLLGVSTAQAAEPPRERQLIERAEAQRFALIVSQQPAPTGLGQVLESRYGFQVVRPDSTLSEIKTGLREIFDSIEPYDQLLIHIALPLVLPEQPGFLPSDGRETESWTLLSLRELIGWLNAMPTGSVLATYPICPGSRGQFEALEELAYGDRPGPVEILLICDPAFVRRPSRSLKEAPTQGSRIDWEGDVVADSIADLLGDAANHDHDHDAEQVSAVTGRQIARHLSDDLAPVKADLLVLPYSSEPAFRLAHIGTEGEYRNRYSRAASYVDLLAVLEEALKAALSSGGAGADPSGGSPGTVALLRDIALSTVADVGHIPLSDRESLQLRSFAVDALTGITTAESRAALRAISTQAIDSVVVRRPAVSALARNTQQEDLATLRQVASQDPDSSIRGTAASSLLKAEDPEAASLFASLLRTERDPRVRANLIGILASFEREEDRTLFEGLLADSDQSIRRAAVSALGGLPLDPDTNRSLLEVLESDSQSRVRESAAYALVQTVSDADDASQRALVTEALVASLEPATQTTAIAAADALGRLGGPEAERALRHTLGADSHSEGLRVAAARGLGQMKSRAAIDDLQRAASSGSPAVRRAAVYALGTIGSGSSPAALPSLGLSSTIAEATRDGDSEVSKEAKRWVEQLGIEFTDSKLESQIALLGDRKNTEGRRQATSELLRTTNPRAVDLLVDLLLDRSTSPDARNDAADLLGRIRIAIGDPEVLEALGRVAADAEDTLLRVYALRSLGAHGEDATETLIAQLDDPAERIRYEAIGALGRIGDPRAQSHLERVRDSGEESTQLRKAAAEALSASGLTYHRKVSKYRN